MRTLDEILTLVSQEQLIVGQEDCPLINADKRILARDILSPFDNPPFDNAAMDGWAVSMADCHSSQSTVLPIGGRIVAGDAPLRLDKKGYAWRIFTGAPIPFGLDTVIMQEECLVKENEVVIPPCQAGSHIRKTGEALKKGDIALKSGTFLRPQEIGLLASLGLKTLKVHKPLSVALLSTGSELRDLGETINPGQIFDTNRYVLKSLLIAMGYQVTDLGIIPDDLPLITDQLEKASTHHDVILSSGGVSVGEADHIKAALMKIGTLDQWKLAIKPGKPMAVGHIGKTVFMGLPGNPVSVMVTFYMIVRPWLARLSGRLLPAPHYEKLSANFSIFKPAGRREFARGFRSPINGIDSVTLFPNQSSGLLTSMTQSNGFVVLPEEQITVSPGDPIHFMPFSQFYD